MKLVVGLGNPGSKYEGTRHNVGFEVVDRLARECLADAPRSKFDGELRQCELGGQGSLGGEGPLGGEKALLLKPQSFMNRSGGSVRQAIDFYQIDAGDLLIVCDDFNLPLGQLRMRPAGSDGGQNGLADVIRVMGTIEVPRLRVGIGPVPDRWDPADFVLGKLTANERKILDVEVARATDAVRTWATAGVLQAMNQFNGKIE